MEVSAMKYSERVLEELKKTNPYQPEFIQAATEVLESLSPVVDNDPRYEKAGLLDENNEWQPKTWQDILDACAAIKEKCPDVVPFWCNSGKATGEATSMQTYEMLLYGTGEKLLNDDNKWITGSDGIKNSLNFLNDIYSNGYGPSLSLVLKDRKSVV